MFVNSFIIVFVRFICAGKETTIKSQECTVLNRFGGGYRFVLMTDNSDNSTIGCLKDEAIKLYYPNRKNAFDKYEEDCNFILTDASGKNFFIQI